MTITWQIFDTKYQIADGVISEVTYGCTVQLENHFDRRIGKLELTGNSTAKGFIQYANLSQETIIGWVKTSLGKAEVTAIETALQNSVTSQQAAKTAETQTNGLPWR